MTYLQKYDWIEMKMLLYLQGNFNMLSIYAKTYWWLWNWRGGFLEQSCGSQPLVLFCWTSSSKSYTEAHKMCLTNYCWMARLQWGQKQNSKCLQLVIFCVNQNKKNKMENIRIPIFTLKWSILQMQMWGDWLEGSSYEFWKLSSEASTSQLCCQITKQSLDW